MSVLQVPSLVHAGVYDAAIVRKNCAKTQRRSVSLFELELPIWKGGICYLDSGAYPIEPDHFICAKPGQTRSTQFPFQCYYVHLSAEPGGLYQLMFGLPDCFFVISPEKYYQIFADIIHAFTFPFPGSEVYLGGKILELIYGAYRDSSHAIEVIREPLSPHIAEAIDFIDCHYLEELCLADIAEAVHLNPAYLHRIFSKAMGKTPYQYLTMRRLDTAKKLLITTTQSLSEIALESGFSSQSYFGYVFKKEFGLTPLRYRKQAYSRYPN